MSSDTMGRIKSFIFTALVTGASSLLVALPGWAHHSIAAGFDMNSEVTVVGTIARMEWRNPHAWLYLNVENEQGEMEEWAIEFGSANALYRRGWRQGDLPVGATVTVTGFPSRDGSLSVSAEDVVLPDGRTLFAGPARGGQ